MRMVFPTQTSGRLMDDLATDVGTLVESFFGDVTDRSRVPGGGRMAVPMDIDESDDAYLVTLDIPGVDADAVAIDVHEDMLTIAGQRGVVKKADDKPNTDEAGTPPPSIKHLRRERTIGKFERKVQLPLAVEADAVTAEISDGVLVVRLPKADPEKGKRRIPISRG
ncbi:MAG: Hsp20/alpha crystallin family protein [Planctomycetales bacterium]|nr:Hsp20/alpha crystallin family protein [Planctomycetales bacterium]